MSSILPRPRDYEVSKEKVKNINMEFKKLCKVRNIKPFLKYGEPMREFSRHEMGVCTWTQKELEDWDSFFLSNMFAPRRGRVGLPQGIRQFWNNWV